MSSRRAWGPCLDEASKRCASDCWDRALRLILRGSDCWQPPHPWPRDVALLVSPARSMVRARGAHVITRSTPGTGKVLTGAIRHPCIPTKPCFTGKKALCVPPSSPLAAHNCLVIAPSHVPHGRHALSLGRVRHGRQVLAHLLHAW